jgi:hypothetical protein
MRVLDLCVAFPVFRLTIKSSFTFGDPKNVEALCSFASSYIWAGLPYSQYGNLFLRMGIVISVPGVQHIAIKNTF